MTTDLIEALDDGRCLNLQVAILLVTRGGGGVSQMLTIADEGGRVRL